MATYAKPYIAGLKLNLHEFVAPQQARNRLGETVRVMGKQKPSLSVDIDLYLGTNRNVGRQNYTFTDKPTPSLSNAHDGLPVYSDLVPDALVETLQTEFAEVIDVSMPEFEDESAETKAVGVAIHPRINSIQANLPFEESKSAERYIAFIVGLYEDKDYTRQIVNADFVVIFAEDAYLARGLGVNVDDLNPAAIAQLRSDNTCYQLKEFMQREEVATAIGSIGQAIFTTLISKVNQWKHMNIQTLMGAFQQSFTAIAR